MELFCDLKTDDEKASFFLSGRAWATGVIAKEIQNDVAMVYQRCAGYQIEIERLRAQNAELLEALEDLVSLSLRYRLQESDSAVEAAFAAIAKARGER